MGRPQPNLAIVCDARPEAGLGHLVRCLGLARALKREGCSVALHLLPGSDPKPPGKLGQGLEMWSMEVDERDPERVRAWAGTALHTMHGLVADGYSLDRQFFTTLGRSFPALCMLAFDDAGEKLHASAHGVLRTGLAAPLDMPGRLALFSAIGPEFAILPESCTGREPKDASGRVKRVLVAMGGGDPEEQSLRLARILLDLSPALYVTVVLGPCHEWNEVARQRFAALGHRLRLLHAPDDFHEQALACDLAVTGGGVTCLEMLHLGIPVAAISLARNQDPTLRELQVRHLGLSLGRFDQVEDAEIAARVHALLSDPDGLRRRSLRGKQLLDGKGASRLAARVVHSVRLFQGQGFGLGEVREEYRLASALEESHQKALWGSEASMQNRFAMALEALRMNGVSHVRSWLDVGCGPGDMLEYGWDAFGSFDYLGLDLCRESILLASERYGSQPGVRYLCADFMREPVGERFDLVTALGVVYKCGHILERSMERLAALLEPGGRLALCSKNLSWAAFDQPELKPYADHAWFTPRRLAGAARSAGLEVLLLKGFDPAAHQWRHLEQAHSMLLVAWLPERVGDLRGGADS